MAAETAAANQQVGRSVLTLPDKADVKLSARMNGDKVGSSWKRREVFSVRGIRDDIQDKAIKKNRRRSGNYSTTA